MATPLALSLDVDTVQTVGVILIGVLVLVAVAFAVLLKAVVGKVIAVVLVLAVAVAVFLQRENLSDCPKTCSCRFFGLELTIPDHDLSNACKDVVSLGRSRQR